MFVFPLLHGRGRTYSRLYILKKRQICTLFCLSIKNFSLFTFHFKHLSLPLRGFL